MPEFTYTEVAAQGARKQLAGQIEVAVRRLDEVLAALRADVFALERVRAILKGEKG